MVKVLYEVMDVSLPLLYVEASTTPRFYSSGLTVLSFCDSWCFLHESV